MRDEHEQEARRHEHAQQQPDRDGGLLGLLRRIVAPRPPEVLVMDRDGQLRRSTWSGRDE